MLQPVPNCYSQFAKPREATNVAAKGELYSRPLTTKMVQAIFSVLYNITVEILRALTIKLTQARARTKGLGLGLWLGIGL